MRRNVVISAAVATFLVILLATSRFVLAPENTEETTCLLNGGEWDGVSEQCVFLEVAISDEEAAALVAKVPEVSEYLNNGVADSPHLECCEVTDDRRFWLAHVFETVCNPDEPCHTATFNRYYVNRETGEVTAEF